MSSGSMELENLGRIHKAILNAFDIDELRQFLLFDLGVDLDEVSSADNDFSTVVFEAVRTADRQGWIEDLVIGAIRSNPGNRELQELRGSSMKFQAGESSDRVGVFLFGIKESGVPGFVQITNAKMDEIESDISDIDKRVARVEISVTDNRTEPDSILVKMGIRSIIILSALAAFGSIAVEIYRLWN